MSDRDHERGAGKAREDGERDDFFRALSIPLLAHELKGPLAVIEAGVATALERVASGIDPARLERTLKRVLRGTRRAQALVDDLLEVGRAEAGQVDRSSFRPAPALIAAVIDAVEAMDAELADRVAAVEGADEASADEASGDDAVIAALGGGGVDLSIAASARGAVIEQDQRKFSLIAANLVRNALRFKSARVAIALDVVDGVASVTVEDDGPGVAAEDRDLIFDRWAQGADAATGSRQGHGLGLAAARVLARSMGGDVTLAAGSNSRFVLAVPAARQG